MLGAAELVENRVAMQRHHPADLQVAGCDSYVGEQLDGFLDHAFGGAPANERDIGVARTHELWRRHRGFDALNLALALFHHFAAFHRIGELVADEYSVLLMLVGGNGVSVTGDARDGARRDT